MKRLIFLLSAAALLFSLAACGPEKAEPSEEPDSKETKIVESSAVPDTSEEDLLLPLIYEIPFEDIYVDVPDLKEIEKGSVEIFWDGKTKYITFTCISDDTANSVAEAHEKAFRRFTDNTFDYLMANRLGEVEEKNIAVNGIDTYRYEGIINIGYSYPYDAYICGYSFAYHGFPCAIIGVVKDDAPPQEEKDAVREIVEAMMQSVRSKQ